MAVVLTTSGGVFHWNLKELVPRKRFTASNDDGILSSAMNPDGISLLTRLTAGDEVAVSDDGGIAIFSLADDTQRKLKGVTVSSEEMLI
jgi:hypothetical protein